MAAWRVIASLGALVGLAFIILKTAGAITWHWAFVLIPYLPAVLVAASYIVFAILAVIAWGVSRLLKLRRKRRAAKK